MWQYSLWVSNANSREGDSVTGKRRRGETPRNAVRCDNPKCVRKYHLKKGSCQTSRSTAVKNRTTPPSKEPKVTVQNFTQPLLQKGKTCNTHIGEEFPIALKKREEFVDDCSLGLGEPYTVVELETLWELTDGNTGITPAEKNNNSTDFIKSWSEKSTTALCIFVQQVHASYPHMSTETWENFFHPFSEHAKTSLLSQYESVNQKSHHSTILPPQLFEIFAKDPSKEVREELTQLEGIPKEVLHKLTLDENYLVRTLLRHNDEIAEKVIPELYAQLLHDLQQNNKEGWCSPVNELWKSDLLEQLTTDPNVAQDVIKKTYLNDYTHAFKAIYRTTTVPQDWVEKRWNRLEQRLVHHVTKVKRRTDIPSKHWGKGNSRVVSEPHERLLKVREELRDIIVTSHASPRQVKNYVHLELEEIMVGGPALEAVEPGFNPTLDDVQGLGSVLEIAPLTEPEIGNYYERLKNSGYLNSFILRGLASNPNAPQYVIQEARRSEKSPTKLLGMPVYRYN